MMQIAWKSESGERTMAERPKATAVMPMEVLSELWSGASFAWGKKLVRSALKVRR